MLVPISWLKEYVNIDNIELKEFCDKMILSGSNIEVVESFGEEIKDVVVGRITRLDKHPDADKLSVVMVDVGNEVLQIVTGATNVNVGDYIPVVRSGGILPGGIKIKKGKLRGIESDGMLCSAKELGYTDKVIPVAHKEGIFILDKEYPLGIDIVEALQLKEDVIEFEITPNRPDCLSMLGMAREAAAVFEGKIEYPDTRILNETDDINKYIVIEVKKPELCRRYTAKVIKDVKIEQSPWWLQKRLIYAGVRPINNIVDITNYVMLEYGQPLHAFDSKFISGNKIIVDTASENQKFETLDGTERKLDANMLLINDAEKGIGLAGVMGGLNSEITAETTTIVIESANFTADNIRATSKKLALRTEASSRFEKGIDPNLTLDAINRVCKLVEMMGAGTIVKGTIDIYPQKYEAAAIRVRPHRINALLGTEMSDLELANIYKRLEMTVKAKGDDLYVTPPTVRLDLKEEIDFLEEAARIYGYDRLNVSVPKGNIQGGKTLRRILEDIIKETLIAVGVNEIQTYSFVSPKGVDMIMVPENSIKRNFVRLINPLGEENSVMRTTLIPNMMDVLVRNYNRNISNAAAFEIGRIFIPSEEKLPNEPLSLVIGMYGEANDFYMLKGVVEAILNKIGIKNVDFEPEANHPTFHPGRCANIIYNGSFFGIMGEIHPDVAENYDISARVYICEIDFEGLIRHSNTEKLYMPLPKYPSVERDIALVVEEKVFVKEIEDIIKSNGGKLLESVELFDIYRGKQVKEGYKSVAYNLVYRDINKTLTDDEVNSVQDRVVKALKEKLGAELRDQ